MTTPPVAVTSITGLAAAVRSARMTHGITQDELARRIGVSRPWVSQFESGRTPHAGIDRVLAMVNVLGITLTVTGPQTQDAARRWHTSETPPPPRHDADLDLEIPPDTDPETAAFLTELLTPQSEQIADAIAAIGRTDHPGTTEES